MKVDSRINGGIVATRNELNKLSLGDFLAITDATIFRMSSELPLKSNFSKPILTSMP